MEKNFYFINKIKGMNKNNLNNEINPDDYENWMIKLNNENIKLFSLFKFWISLTPKYNQNSNNKKT